MDTIFTITQFEFTCYIVVAYLIGMGVQKFVNFVDNKTKQAFGPIRDNLN